MILIKFSVPFMLLLSGGACAQQNLWKRFDVDRTRNFYVESFNKVVDLSSMGESYDTVKAALVIDSSEYDVIRFARASCKNGGVSIFLYETNEAYDHEYTISIMKNKYIINYNRIVSGAEDGDGIMLAHETYLVLNTSDFKVGTVLKGYTEFKGKCATCKNHNWVNIKGSFEVVIR